MSFIAVYPGLCPQCDTEVKGTECQFNFSDEVAHVTCPEADDQPGRNEVKCPDCFTIHAGECA